MPTNLDMEILHAVKSHFTYDTFCLGGVALVGEKIRDLRRKLGLTQEQLARPELTKSYVSQVELGRIRPSQKALEIMALRLGKPLGYFLDNEEELRTIEVLRKAAHALELSGRYEESLTGLKEALHLAERVGRDDLYASIEVRIGRLKATTGDPQAAISHLTTALNHLSLVDSPKLAVEIRADLARASADIGAFYDAVAHFHDAVRIAQRQPQNELLALILVQFGDLFCQHREWQSAHQLYQQAASSLKSPALSLSVRLLTSQTFQTSRPSSTLADQVTRFLDTLNDTERGEEWGRLAVDAARLATWHGLYDPAHTVLEEALIDHLPKAHPDLWAPAIETALLLAASSDNMAWITRYTTLAEKHPKKHLNVMAQILQARLKTPLEAFAMIQAALASIQETSDGVTDVLLLAVKAELPDAIRALFAYVVERPPLATPLQFATPVTLQTDLVKS